MDSCPVVLPLGDGWQPWAAPASLESIPLHFVFYDIIFLGSGGVRSEPLGSDCNAARRRSALKSGQVAYLTFLF